MRARPRMRRIADANVGRRALTDDQRPTGIWAVALLHALARDEPAGRRTQRITEPKLDTWSRFRGRLNSADFVALLFEDAAVIHRVPFDPATLGGLIFPERLPESSADSWIKDVGVSPARWPGSTTSPSSPDSSGCRRGSARSELHVVKPHQKVLEPPGTGGQLAHHLVSAQRDLTLHDNFTIACSSWQELTLAGVIALEMGAPHSDFATRVELEDLRKADHPLRQRTFDFVIGLHPDKGGLFPHREPTRDLVPDGEGPAGVTMAAQFIPIGEPAHDAERQALRFLVAGLPSTYTVYGNAWLVERAAASSNWTRSSSRLTPSSSSRLNPTAGASRARTTIGGSRRDRSPLKLNRVTAQVLKTHLRHARIEAGQVWTEGLVFLSATTDVGVRGPASTDRVQHRGLLPRRASRPSARRTSEPG